MAVPPDISGSLLRPGNLILGRYELIRELGRGGMGVVWLARDRTLQIDLAFKFLPDVLRQDKASLDELREEAVRNLRLTNEHIVRTYDFIEGEGVAGITMEYVDGWSLAGLKVERPAKHLEVAELLPLIRNLCEALHYAHTAPKVVHRDLKPANLMVTRDGRLKVTDFGIARSISESFSRVSNAQPTSGTLMFMSPQQLMGEPPRPSDDIYSVGATIYDLLTSKPPFFSGSIHAQVIQATAPTMGERRAQLQRPGEVIPTHWEELVSACLAKEPSGRPATALDIIRRLESQATTPAVSSAELPALTLTPVPATAPAASGWQSLPPVPTLPGFGPASAPQPQYATLPPPPAPRAKQWGLLVMLILIGMLTIAGGIYMATKGTGSDSNVTSSAPTPVPDVAPIPAKPGRMILNTIPSGARVFIDGGEVGTTPMTLNEIEAGDHRVRLEKVDYEPLDLTMHVEPGATVDRGALPLVAIVKAATTPVPVPQPPVAEAGLSEAMARAVAARYVTCTQQRDVSGLLDCYADPIDYHDEGMLGRAKLRASIGTYFHDWPYFGIEVISSEITPTGDPNVKDVKVNYRFLAKSGSKISRGMAHDQLTVKRFGDGALITRFRQTVTDRSKNF